MSRVFENDLAMNINLTKQDVEEVFIEYYIAYNEKQISPEEKDLFIVACLYMKILVNEYKTIKGNYIDKMKESHYIDVEEIKQTLKGKITSYEQERKQYEQEREQQTNEIALLSEELEATKKELERERLVSAKKEDESKELYALREYIFHHENEDLSYETYTENESIEEIASFLANKKLVIVGGHINWQNKLKEKLPNLTFVNSGNSDLPYLNNKDAIFINTSINSHSLYYKVTSIINKMKFLFTT
jgi:hypothetical protein